METTDSSACGMEPRLADYFITVGLGDNVKLLDVPREELDWAVSNGSPVTDLGVIYGRNEKIPAGWQCIESTPSGKSANLNPINIGKIYLCYTCGHEKPPIVEIGVLYPYKKQSIPKGHDVLVRTLEGKHDANVNSSRKSTYLTYRRAVYYGHQKAITHLAVIHEDEPIPPGFQCLKLNLNKGMGPRIFVCYKSAVVRPPGTCFKPTILSRYPNFDYEDFPLTTDHVPMFCMPVGVSVELWNDHSSFPLPTFSTFVLTSVEAIKMYGATVAFYEELKQHPNMSVIQKHVPLDDDKNPPKLYVNKSICVLSRWPFFTEFKAFLSTIYRVSLSQGTLPIERYIQNLMDDCPFPSIERPRVMIDFGIERFYFSVPHKTPMPFVGLVHCSLLVSLDVDNLLSVLTLVMLEQKVVFLSSRPALLTSVGEAIKSVLFPLKWQCTDIPMCPLSLATYIEAPVPFIIGIDSRYMWMAEEFPDDVTFIDLDTNIMKIPDDMAKILDNCKVPKRCSKPLKKTLKALAETVSKLDLGSDLAVDLAPPGYRGDSYKADIKKVDTAIREAFLCFNALLLQDYKTYLKPIDSPVNDFAKAVNRLFDSEEFIKSQLSDRGFFNVFVDTQLFCSFIEQRSFFSSEDQSFTFFDDCIPKVKNGCEIFSTSAEDNNWHKLGTIVAPPPDGSGLEPGKRYVYEAFPAVQLKLFKSHTKLHQPSSEDAALVVHQRTKQERQGTYDILLKNSDLADGWPKSLLTQVYIVWFLHLPTLLERHWNKRAVLDTAYQLLQRMKLLLPDLPSIDQVAYRVLMDQYTKSAKPAMAVKVMTELQQHGAQANATTYGFYNQAMIEADWPLSKKYWKLYKCVFGACWFLRELLKKKKKMTFKTEPAALHPSGMATLSVASPTTQRRAETLSAGIGIPLMARLTSFPMYDPNIPTLEDKTAPKITPKAFKRLSSFLPATPKFDKARRISVIHKTTPSKARPKPWELSVGTKYIVEISSCSPCPSCHAYIYDEDIMSGWSPSESEYNTVCPYCQNKLVPNLTVRIKKLLQSDEDVPTGPDNAMIVDRCISVDPLSEDPPLSSQLAAMRSRGHSRSSSVPMATSPVKSPPSMRKKTSNSVVYGPHISTYLSPVVLRKELERHLRQEKEIISRHFMETSKDLFWNMLWYFSRTGLQSYLLHELTQIPGLEGSLNQEFAIDTWWDRLPDVDPAPCPAPLYSLDRQGREDGLMNHVRAIQLGNVRTGIMHLLEKVKPSETRTLYRDVSLLVCALQGPDFDADTFDQHFKEAVKRVQAECLGLMARHDTQTPSPQSVQCRKLFWTRSNSNVQ